MLRKLTASGVRAAAALLGVLFVALSSSNGAVSAAPALVTVSGITPNDLAANITTTVGVVGSGFRPGATLTFRDPNSTGNVSVVMSVSVDSATHITATIHTGTPGGPFPNREDVIVTNRDSGQGVLSQGLTVDIVPIPIHVSPDAISQGSTVEVFLNCIRCGSPVIAASVSGTGVQVVAVGDYRLTLQVSPYAPLGDRTITAFTANRGSIPFMITVVGRVAPAITGFTPTSGPPGGMVTISGTGFTGVGSVNLNGAPVSIVSSNPTTIVVKLNGWNTTGAFTVSLPGGVSTTSAGIFTVTSASSALVITDFSPSSGPPGSMVTISGTGFTGVASVNLNGAPVRILSSNAATIVVKLNNWNSTGKFTVNLPGGVSTTSTGTFTVA